MNTKLSRIRKIVYPSKLTNIFVLCLVLLGVTAGAIFLNVININEQTLVIDKIKLFIENINTNNINTLLAFNNSISINLLYILVIWLLGMSLIGIPIIIFVLFIKSFLLGFSLSSFIITYSYKGLLLSILYLLITQLLNIIALSTITIYSIMFSKKLFNTIFKNNNNNIKYFLKNYIIILIISIILSIISTLGEVFILPPLIKLIIKLFI